jgi:hypothetical protein
MRFVHCVLAECALAVPRFTRTRLGISLLAVGAALIWLGAHALDPPTVSLLAGSLGAIVTAGGIAGSEHERRALTTALSHPTTPLAIAIGRWGVIVTAAALLVAGTAGVHGDPRVAIAGIAAAGAVGACALAAALALGNAAVTGLFLFVALAGSIAPERLVALAHPTFIRIAAASALELGPALWHYRAIASGDWSPLTHAIAWAVLGILLASACIGRRR